MVCGARMRLRLAAQWSGAGDLGASIRHARQCAPTFIVPLAGGGPRRADVQAQALRQGLPHAPGQHARCVVWERAPLPRLRTLSQPRWMPDRMGVHAEVLAEQPRW